MSFSHDVAVVGAGPAGCSAAIWCAMRGLRVVLIEASEFPRDRPGESLHPGIEPLFEQLGVLPAVHEAGYVRYPGHWVSWGGASMFQAFGGDDDKPWLGYHALRADLDSRLLARARSAGATVLQPCRASGPLWKTGRVAGVRCAAGDLRARFVIDASGPRHWLRRQMGLPIRTHSRPLIAAFGYSKAEAGGQDECPTLEAHKTGWTWVARIQPAIYAWTRLELPGVALRAPDRIAASEPLGPARGADVTWRILERCAGPGYFVAGDAACVLDPSGSHGVLKAIMSGILAADVIGRVLEGATSESAAAEVFRAWTLRWFEHDVARLSELYSAANLPAVLQGSVVRTKFLQ